MVDEDGFVVGMYDRDADAMLGFYCLKKPHELTLYSCLAVDDVDPAIAAVIVCVNDPVLPTVDAHGFDGSDDIDVNTV
jgi:hypothetical protein